MNKRPLTIILVLLLAAGCKRANKGADSTPTPGDTTRQDTAAIVATDTTYSDTSSTSLPTATTTTRLQMENDSAEITNLRILTRKQKVIYDASLLIGEWVRGTEHEVYLADGTGRMWDTSDDVSRDEAQSFKWTLDSNLLTLVCNLELGGYLPKRYVVTYADDENLAYNDLFGSAYLWDKKSR